MTAVTRILLVVVACAGLAAPADAQPSSTSPSLQRLAEVGVAAGVFGADGATGPSWLVRSSVAVSPRLAVEGALEVFDVSRASEYQAAHVSGLWLLVVRIGSAWNARQLNVFATLGTGGGFAWRGAKDYEWNTPGSDVPLRYHEKADTSVSGPIFVVGGVGLQRPISQRAAIRVDVQGFTAPQFGLAATAIRASAGLALGIGGPIGR